MRGSSLSSPATLVAEPWGEDQLRHAGVISQGGGRRVPGSPITRLIRECDAPSPRITLHFIRATEEGVTGNPAN